MLNTDPPGLQGPILQGAECPYSHGSLWKRRPLDTLQGQALGLCEGDTGSVKVGLARLATGFAYCPLHRLNQGSQLSRSLWSCAVAPAMGNLQCVDFGGWRQNICAPCPVPGPQCMGHMLLSLAVCMACSFLSYSSCNGFDLRLIGSPGNTWGLPRRQLYFCTVFHSRKYSIPSARGEQNAAHGPGVTPEAILSSSRHP